MQVAIFATFTTIALLAFANFGGTNWARTRANLILVLTGLALVPLGTALSRGTWAPAVVMTGVVFVISLGGMFGGYFASGAPAAILFYVLSSGLAAPDSAIGPRMAGVLLGGTLATVAAVTLWPSRPRERFSHGLGADYRRLAAALGSRNDPDPVPPAERESRLRAELVTGRAYRQLVTQRTHGPTAVDLAQLYLLHELELFGSIIAGVLGAGDRVSGRLGAVTDELLSAVEQTLDACGRALQGEPLLPDPVPLAASNQAYVEASDVLLADLAAAAPDRFGTAADQVFRTRRLAAAAVVAGAKTLVVRGAPFEPPGPATDSTLGGEIGATGRESPWSIGWRRLRTNLSFESVYLRNSIRAALGLGAARALVGLLDLSYGFWVVLATLTVLRSRAAATSVSALQAVAGTLAGCAAGIAVVVALGGTVAGYAILLPVVVFLANYTSAVVGYAVGQAFFSLLIITLFNLLSPARWQVGLFRAEDVLVGAVIGVVLGYAIWPRGAAGQVRSAIAGLYRAAAEYAARTVDDLIAARPDEGLPVVRRQTLDAALRAEDVTAEYLQELERADVVPARLPALMAGGYRLLYATEVLRILVRPAGRGTGPEPLRQELGALVDTMRRDMLRVAAWLQPGSAGGSAAHPPAQAGAPGGLRAVPRDPAAVAPVVWLYELRAWLTVMDEQVRGLLPDGPGTPSPAVRAPTA